MGNRSAYVSYNGLHYVDPSGYFFQFLVAAIVAIAKIAAATAIVAGAGSLLASATGHDRMAHRLAGISTVSSFVAMPLLFAEGAAVVSTSQLIAGASEAAAHDPVEKAFAGPSFDAPAPSAPLQRTASAVFGYGVGVAAWTAALAPVGLAARAVAKRVGPHVTHAAQRTLRKLAARLGPRATSTSADEAITTLLKQVDTLDFSTGPGQAVFYSGPGQLALAEGFAQATGKMTIGMTPGGRSLDASALMRSLSPEQQGLIWEKAAAHFARGASGKIYAFVKGSRPTSIFRRIEEPILLGNRKVHWLLEQ